MSKSIFELSPGLEEKMTAILTKYEDGLRRRKMRENIRLQADGELQQGEELMKSGSKITEWSEGTEGNKNEQ